MPERTSKKLKLSLDTLLIAVIAVLAVGLLASIVFVMQTLGPKPDYELECNRLRNVGNAAFKAKDYVQAEGEFIKAVGAAEKAESKLLLANVLAQLGEVYTAEGKPAAQECLKKAISLYNDVHPSDEISSESVARQRFLAIVQLARCFNAQNQVPQAIAQYEEALKLTNELPVSNMERINCQQEYAAILRETGRTAEANKVTAGAPPDAAADLHDSYHRGLDEMTRGKFDSAEAFFKTYYDQNAQLHRNWQAAHATNLIALCQLRNGTAGSGGVKQLCQRALTISEQTAQPQKRAITRAEALTVLGVVQAIEGDQVAARQSSAEALKLSDVIERQTMTNAETILEKSNLQRELALVRRISAPKAATR